MENVNNIISLVDYYQHSRYFLDKWKTVQIDHDGIYEVCLHSSVFDVNGLSLVFEMPPSTNNINKQDILKQSIHGAILGKNTYIKIGHYYYPIEADILETHR